MRKLIACALLVMILTLAGCASGGSAPSAASSAVSSAITSVSTASTSAEASSSAASENAVAKTLKIQVGEEVLEASLEDNSSAEALAELLASGPITVDMHDYGDFEKVGPLPQSLPTNDVQITTEPGDVILYQGNQITIYYDTNTWEFTRLAKVEGASRDSLLAILGDGDVEVTLSI